MTARKRFSLFVLIATLRWWKDQLVELIALIAINHVVTFFAYAAAAVMI